jgi:hypothetical protein
LPKSLCFILRLGRLDLFLHVQRLSFSLFMGLLVNLKLLLKPRVSYFKVKFCKETSVASWTNMLLDSRVHFHVLAEVLLLSEAEGATVMSALVRFLSGMRSGVVEEVVPLRELLATHFEITLYDLYFSLWRRVLKGKYSEVLNLGLNLINFERFEIKFIAILHSDCGISFHFLEERALSSYGAYFGFEGGFSLFTVGFRRGQC